MPVCLNICLPHAAEYCLWFVCNTGRTSVGLSAWWQNCICTRCHIILAMVHKPLFLLFKCIIRHRASFRVSQYPFLISLMDVLLIVVGVAVQQMFLILACTVVCSSCKICSLWAVSAGKIVIKADSHCIATISPPSLMLLNPLFHDELSISLKQLKMW